MIRLNLKYRLPLILSPLFLILLIRSQSQLNKTRDDLDIFRKDFDLVSIKTQHSKYVLISLKNVKRSTIVDSDRTIVRQELSELLTFFYESNLFILDVEILKGVFKEQKGLLNSKLGLVNFNKADEFRNRTFHLEKINTIFNASSIKKTHINYGLSFNDFIDFYQVKLN